MGIHGVNRVITVACVVGILVSTYALYVEMAVEAHPEYKALCDLAKHASCTKVLSSPYAKGLGLMPEESQLKMPNCVYGIIYYCLILLLTTFDNVWAVKLQLGVAAASLLTCVYLAYILVFILQDFCVVCVSSYVFNIIILLSTNKKNKLLKIKNK